MSDLVFDCVDARAERHAAVPTISLALRIAETTGTQVDAIPLRCQIRIEPHRRRYSAAEAAGLHDLFGDPSRWADTVKPMQLTTLSTMVPGFTGSVTVDLPLTFTYDLEIASSKYFSALEDGAIPLLILYSGTIFTTVDGRMSVQQIPWSKESAFPLPSEAWREAVDAHFPNSGWLRLPRETLDALRHFKTANALPTWDSTILALLTEASEPNH